MATINCHAKFFKHNRHWLNEIELLEANKSPAGIVLG